MGTKAAPEQGPTSSETGPHGFHQKLGLFDATMLVAGSMVGSGIFVVSSIVAKEVGSSGWLLAIWILTGIMTVMGALCYVELSSMMPHAGGQYVYLREAYSPLWGFLYGWTIFLVIQTGFIAAILVAFGKFLGVLVPQLGPDNIVWPSPGQTFTVLDKPFTVSAAQLVAAGIVVFLTLLNCRGVEAGKLVQNIFTVAKMLTLIALIVIGLGLAANSAAIQANLSNLWSGITDTELYQKVSSHRLVPSSPSLVALMVAGGAMVAALFAADAWNTVTFTGAEVKNPRRNLPLSLVLGVVLVIVLYLFANVTYMAVLPVKGDAELAAKLEKESKEATTPAARAAVEEEYVREGSRLGIDQAHNDRVATAVMDAALPKYGTAIMAIAIMISAFGCANGIILGGARLLYAMARDKLFFQSVGRLNGRGVPAAGLILQGAWSILLIFSGTYGELLDYVIFATLLFYVLTVVGLFVLRWKRPDAERPYRTLGYPIMPAVYVVLCAVIMLNLLIVKPMYTWPGLIIVLTGIPVYFLWKWRSGGRVAG